MKLPTSGAGLLNPVPRCRQRNGTAKIQTVNGSRVEIFSRLLRKNTTCPLTVWIGGADKKGLPYVAIPFLYLLFFGMYRWGVKGFNNQPHAEPETMHKVFIGIR